jgi:hypothetical protein
MARKTAIVTISDEGRDQGKIFLLTEMSATQAELWAIRVFMSMAKSGVPVPEDFKSLGIAGLARIGLSALSSLSFNDAKPLLDELFTCVNIIPDRANQNFSRDLLETDIEEIATRLQLRLEVLKLHFDFLKAVKPLMSGQASAAAEASKTG